MKHTVVISDVHLCEGVTEPGAWMRWRQPGYFPDDKYEALIERLLGDIPEGDTLELVFNGDLFDFDAGRVVHGKATFEDLPRTEPVAMELLGRILDDHQGFVAGTARALAAGHRVTFVSGNHDPQLGFEGVRRLMRERLAIAALDHSVGQRVGFRAWFHQTDDGIHIEHGNQYDPFCAFRYPMVPHLPPERGKDRAIQPTVGSITFRYLGARLGFMNPHLDESWDMSLPQYLKHWFKNYVRTDHSLAVTWLAGTWRIVFETIARRDEGSSDRRLRNVEAAARETGCDPERIALHAELFAPPADESLRKLFRQFWVDRIVLGGLSAVAITVPLFVRNRKVVGTALSLPLLMAIYELATPSASMNENYRHIAVMAERIAKIYGVRAVVFGHTHVPYARWIDGVFHGNSGTWSVPMRDVAEAKMEHDLGKPVVWIRTDAERMEAGVYRWDGRDLTEDVDRTTVVSDFPPSGAEAVPVVT